MIFQRKAIRILFQIKWLSDKVVILKAYCLYSLFNLTLDDKTTTLIYKAAIEDVLKTLKKISRTEFWSF